MSQRAELNSYIARLQSRLRLRVSLRGAAILTATALVVTLALVIALNRYAFPDAGVVEARWGLIAALAIAATTALLLPLLRLTRASAVRTTEQAHPELEERLTTFHERERAGNDPFLELLAADTLTKANYAPASSLAPSATLLAFAGAGLACLGVLLWMIFSGPSYVGYGASLLWRGAKDNTAPLYAIAVKPGDVAVRRNSDQLIIAQLKGLHPEKVQLFAHYASAAGWEPVAMQSMPDASGAASYQFAFTGLPENVEYYVAAGPLASPHYKVRVVDLPSVKEVRVTYHYPKWTGLKPVVENHSGDLRAIEGTDASIEVQMDRPLRDGQLTLDGGKTIHLAGDEGNRYQGSIHMEKDGAYHIAASDQGQTVRLSEDYFIATDKAQPPEVAIDRPGHDYHASPIEEVKVDVKAAATFGLNDVHLHYSVNGGPDRDVSMLKSPGSKDADGSFVLHLEDFKLVPGDLVSLYATAKDGHAEARTDITFIQADPFEREFSQSQQSGGGGGGGGGGGNQTEISKREKELIAATWKQQNDKTATPKENATQGQFLADAQNKLRDQVLALSARMQTRDLSQANEEFNGFEKDMQTAAKAMAPSSEKLKDTAWKDALPLEQKALQALLRAEATFRQIQVAFGQQSGGGGGGGSSGRDLASLFDLELDTEKNQYETAQAASPQEQHAKDVEDALQKLDALAKRQEELASQQHNPQQSFQERWQQEMLRREAEQLQRQMEQIAQNNQGQQQNGQGQQSPSQQGNQGQQSDQNQQNGNQQANRQQSGSQSSSAQSGPQQGSRSGSQQAGNGSAGQQQQGSQSPGSLTRQNNAQSTGQQDQHVQQALSRLRQAGDAMKRSGNAQGTSDAAKQAADRLREATNLLGGEQQQLASSKMDSLSREASRLSNEEHTQADRINKLATSPSDYTSMTADAMQARLRDRNQLAGDRQRLSDDLSKLQKNVRNAAREMASNQPGAAQKLRDALTQMDQSDLDNHVQRTADWLRRGVNPNSNGTESEIAKGLQQLIQQLQEAQRGVGQSQGKPGQRSANPGDQVAALNQAERLRNQLEAMASSRNGNGQRGQNDSQPGNRPSRANGNNGQQQSSQQASNGQQQGQGQGRDGQQGNQNGQPGGQGGYTQQAMNRDGQRGGNGSDRNGDPGGSVSGDVRTGGGGRNADGTAWNNVNTGNNRYGQATKRPVPLDSSGNPADTERTYQQSMRELSQLRQMVQGDPQASREVQDLARKMQQLDPSRFPGNPTMVEHMHQEVLSAVDKLEIQLDRNSTTEARTGKPYAVPSGYQDSVAEYYKRLSSKQ